MSRAVLKSLTRIICNLYIEDKNIKVKNEKNQNIMHIRPYIRSLKSFYKRGSTRNFIQVCQTRRCNRISVESIILVRGKKIKNKKCVGIYMLLKLRGHCGPGCVYPTDFCIFQQYCYNLNNQLQIFAPKFKMLTKIIRTQFDIYSTDSTQVEECFS